MACVEVEEAGAEARGTWVDLGDSVAATTAAATAGLDAMAAMSSGESVAAGEVVSAGVLGDGPAGRPEWSMVSASGTDERALIPRLGAVVVVEGLEATAISWRCREKRVVR